MTQATALLKDRFLRPREAALKLRVARQTLYTWIAEGILPPVTHQTPRVTGWPESVLDRWLAEKRAASAAAYAARVEAKRARVEPPPAATA